MHFGNSPRTRETERLMKIWRSAHPNHDTPTYNREYERVWGSLTEFSAAEDGPSYFDRAEAVEQEQRERTHRAVREQFSDGGPKRNKRVCKANYPKTKGAFGRCKKR